jgi:hypothetical protein
MPTIEIASINSTTLNLKQADFDIAIIEENELISHRGLFHEYLNSHSGVIIHIGNPEFKEEKEGFFFAGQLIDWNFTPDGETTQDNKAYKLLDQEGANEQVKFKFMEPFISEINKLLEAALDSSPVKKVFFLTDYQFGPEKANIEIISTIKDFWYLHDNDGLTFNTLYELCRP